MKKPFFLTMILLAFLSAGCQSQSVNDSKMEEIAGRYEYDANASYTTDVPQEYWPGQIAKSGNDWFLDVTLRGALNEDPYIHVSVKVYWNQVLGKYMFDKEDTRQFRKTVIYRDLEYLDVSATELVLAGGYHWRRL